MTRLYLLTIAGLYSAIIKRKAREVEIGNTWINDLKTARPPKDGRLRRNRNVTG